MPPGGDTVVSFLSIFLSKGRVCEREIAIKSF